MRTNPVTDFRRPRPLKDFRGNEDKKRLESGAAIGLIEGGGSAMRSYWELTSHGPIPVLVLYVEAEDWFREVGWRNAEGGPFHYTSRSAGRAPWAPDSKPKFSTLPERG